MATTDKHKEKWRVVRQFKGSLCLDNAVEEQVCTLLADGQDLEEVRNFFKLSSLDFEAIQSTDLFKRRIAYIKSHPVQQESLKTKEDWRKWVLKGLRKLTTGAKKDGKIRIAAFKAIDEINCRESAAPSVPTDTRAAIELAKSFGGKGG